MRSKVKYLGGICIVLILLLAGCSGQKATPTTKASTSPATSAATSAAKPATTSPATSAAAASYQWPKSFTIGSPAVGSGGHTVNAGIAPALESDTKMAVRLLPEGTTAVRIENVIKGVSDSAGLGTSHMISYYQGIGGFVSAMKGQLRVAYYQCPFPYSFHVRDDSPIKTIYDIKNQSKIRISRVPAVPHGDVALEKGLPAFLGMTEKEVADKFVWVQNADWTSHSKSVVDGRADITTCTIPSAQGFEIASHPIKVRSLGMPASDKAGWERFLACTYGLVPNVVQYGPDLFLGDEGFADFQYLVVKDTADEEFIYQLTKWLHKKYDLYGNSNPMASWNTMDNFRESLAWNPLPLHPGAIKYLREIGVWTAKDDVWNQAGIDLLTKWVDAWTASAAEAKAKSINIAANNADWVNLWKKYTANIPSIVFRVSG